MRSYWRALNRFDDFEGRSTLVEYWAFVFTSSLVLVAIIVFEAQATGGSGHVLSMIYQLLMVIPALAVKVRRLHDTGHSGWWVPIGYVPFIGLLPFYWLIRSGDRGVNAYGPDPKQPAPPVHSVPGHRLDASGHRIAGT